MRLSSRGAYANTDNSYANFGPFAVNENEGVVNAGYGNNTFNSNDNSNDNYYAVRPVASIHCGYAINGCIRDNIETNYVL